MHKQTQIKMMTRSSFLKNAAVLQKIAINAKGYPTVGHLTIKPVTQPRTVNDFLQKCTSLEATAETFSEMIDIIHYITKHSTKGTKKMEAWCEEVYLKLYDYVDRKMQPTFDEIDAMLLVCRILIQNKMKDRLQEFILNCPKKFIMTYSNNSERTPAVLHELDLLGLGNIRAYLISHVHESKLGTWNERRNTHQRGNALLECTI